jgi:hypothetical protein
MVNRSRHTKNIEVPNAEHTPMLHESSPHAEIEHVRIIGVSDAPRDIANLKAGKPPGLAVFAHKSSPECFSPASAGNPPGHPSPREME